MLVGVELDGFGVEIGCDHHMFLNMHKREIEKQICLKFSNNIQRSPNLHFRVGLKQIQNY